MKRKIAMVLAAAVVAASSAMGSSLPAKAEVNPYTTEGTHFVNGREWRTKCEPYSQTQRCRTEIKATQVTEVKGQFVATTGWFFNNLTYLPSPRSLWAKNRLGYTNDWVDASGRKWSTSCDTPSTGRNGCRTYAEARVIEAYQANGRVQYRWVTKSIFNNIVQFTIAQPAKPTPPANGVVMPDAKLRACIYGQLGKPATAAISLSAAQEITELDCSEGRISNLAGLEKLPNLELLFLDDNQISNLKPLSGLKKLQSLSLYHNTISDVKPLASLNGLIALELSDNDISDITPLKTLTSLEELSISANRVTNLASVSSLKELTWLSASDNQITSLAPLSTLKQLQVLDVSFNAISDSASLGGLTNLEVLSISETGIKDISTLSALRKLVALDAVGNGIVDISALAGMTDMEALVLDSNAIEDITPLGSMTALTWLSLSDNAMVNIAPLARLTQLEWLDLAMNNIAVVAPLAALSNLQELWLWDNPITDRASLDPLIERGCEVYFDEPDWEDTGDDESNVSRWDTAVELAGITSNF